MVIVVGTEARVAVVGDVVASDSSRAPDGIGVYAIISSYLKRMSNAGGSRGGHGRTRKLLVSPVSVA